ncbi:MAG TPA: 2-oxo-4-hydroxy-4-carboxy-5-ureidoimidazoline decarboxylase [Aestuariivirgaceae bacterium]|nr:2-oxo-4-hydroxy-4-carboxy-5-ureidoimidazoline decarboxylase [Aestuariivirgaceae bacterium]
MTLAEVNALAAPAFVARFGDVAEHSTWVAERAETQRPFANVDAMVAAFQAAIHDASEAERLRLIRAHPDLAGRAAMAEESRKEQAGAGLDRLSADEFARFTDLNSRYRERFGIPFILAVRGATRHQILDSFTARLGNDRDTELANALDQVCHIVGFRLAEWVAP